MRIIAGTHRGRAIEAPPGLTTRPMTDRVRENLFNILGPEACVGAAVLDLFCGSGALGLESLSRGADEATFVDAGPDAVKAVETNAARLRLTPQTRVLRRDALRPGGWIRPRGRAAYGIVFIDPPYKMTADPAGQADLAAMAARLVELGVVAAGATVMLRAKRGVEIPLPWDGFDLADTRSYGSTTLYLLSPRPGGAGAQGEGDADRRPAGMETA